MDDVRLIDANIVMSKLKAEVDNIPKRTNYPIGIADGLSYAMATIDCTPTVDAVPVKKDGLIFERLLVTGSPDKPYYEIEHIENGKRYIGYSSYNIDVVSQFLKDYFGINAVPVKRGHWIIEKEEPMYGGHKKIWALRCSDCGKDPIKHIGGGLSNWWFKTPPFCPVCGADMRGENNV